MMVPYLQVRPSPVDCETIEKEYPDVVEFARSVTSTNHKQDADVADFKAQNEQLIQELKRQREEFNNFAQKAQNNASTLMPPKKFPAHDEPTEEKHMVPKAPKEGDALPPPPLPVTVIDMRSEDVPSFANTAGLPRRAGTAQGSAAQTEPRKCYYCGLTGHITSECPAAGGSALATRGRGGLRGSRGRGGAAFGCNQFGGRRSRPEHDRADDDEYTTWLRHHQLEDKQSNRLEFEGQRKAAADLVDNMGVNPV
jgi:hypothetical protein